MKQYQVTDCKPLMFCKIEVNFRSCELIKRLKKKFRRYNGYGTCMKPLEWITVYTLFDFTLTKSSFREYHVT